MSFLWPAGTTTDAVELRFPPYEAVFRLFRLAAGTNTHHVDAAGEGGGIMPPNSMDISFARSTCLFM